MLRVRTTLSLIGLALIKLGCESADVPATPQPSAAPTTESSPPPSPAAAPSELAALDSQPDRAAILEDARAEATRCDAGDARGCRALANRYEEGIGVPADPARALALYERGCTAGEGYDCLLAGWLATASPDADQRARGVALLRRACELDHLHACVAAAGLLAREDPESPDIAGLRAQACRGGYLIACDGELAPATTVTTPSAEAACPASFHWSASQSGGPRLHGTLDQLDHAAMLATIPEVVPMFTTERRGSTPAGRAGTRTAVATAEFVNGDTRASLVVVDRAPDCTLQPGTGTAMISRAIHDQGGRAVDVAGLPAVVVDSKPVSPELPAGLALTVWVADRCGVAWTATGLAEPELLALARTIDWVALTRLCAQRPGRRP